MRSILWSLYGLATALSVFLVLMNGAVGALEKTYLVIGLMLVGSLLAAILHLADSVTRKLSKGPIAEKAEIEREL